MANSTLSILQDAKFDFVLDDKASTTEYFVLRTQYCNGDEVETFIRELERLTNSNFRVQAQRKDPTKIVFRKRWVCKHSSFKKRPGSKQNVGCKSFIDVMIKKITENTRKTDPFLRRKDPLPCVIKIDLNHIHSTECADAIRKLDVTPEIIREFEEYFKNGLAVCEARRLHESKLITNYNHAITYNSAYNPTEKQVYYLYNKWRKINYGSISDPFTKLKEKLSYYENEGSIVKFQEDNIWSILIITPVMQRIQQLVTSSEIIFLDSTSGCESTGSTVTVLIASTKAGGIPIAVILHPCQTEESYANAFKLLKDSASSCFGGKKSPAIFMSDDSAAEKNALQTVWPDSRQLLCHFHVAQAEWRWLTSHMSDVCPGERQEVMKLLVRKWSLFIPL